MPLCASIRCIILASSDSVVIPLCAFTQCHLFASRESEVTPLCVSNLLFYWLVVNLWSFLCVHPLGVFLWLVMTLWSFFLCTYSVYFIVW